MRTRRLLRRSLSTVTGLALCLLAVVPITSAQAACTLTATPAVAAAGTEFTLRGSGFTPTELVLQKQGGQPVTLTLDLGSDDPFEIPIGSRPGDEGRWHATAKSSRCSAGASFTVTLQSTDTIEEVLASGRAGALPPVVYLAVIVFGFAAGGVLGRRFVRA
ncbi:MAG: hypothetical protein M3N29_01370 [Chloroflexota bacterium]|nr:hypothetical protein [Chloroflexota bacterium]